MSASGKDGCDAKSETSECVNSTIDGIARNRVEFQERQSAKSFENFLLYISFDRYEGGDSSVMTHTCVVAELSKR